MLVLQEDLATLLVLAVESAVRKPESDENKRVRYLAYYMGQEMSPVQVAKVYTAIHSEVVGQGWQDLKRFYQQILDVRQGRQHGEEADTHNTNGGSGSGGDGEGSAGGDAGGGGDNGGGDGRIH